MSNCTCCSCVKTTCDPCDCQCQSSCCASSATSTTTMPVNCDIVTQCVKADLDLVLASEPAQIDNFCEASTFCFNEALFNFPLGDTEPLDNLPQAIFSVLRSITGYTNSGTITLKVVNGVLQWISE